MRSRATLVVGACLAYGLMPVGQPQPPAADTVAGGIVQADDPLWSRLRRHFSEPQIVELGYFIGFTMGQQRFLRTLNLRHGRILPEPAAPDETAASTAEKGHR